MSPPSSPLTRRRAVHQSPSAAPPSTSRQRRGLPGCDRGVLMGRLHCDADRFSYAHALADFELPGNLPKLACLQFSDRGRCSSPASWQLGAHTVLRAHRQQRWATHRAARSDALLRAAAPATAPSPSVEDSLSTDNSLCVAFPHLAEHGNSPDSTHRPCRVWDRDNRKTRRLARIPVHTAGNEMPRGCRAPVRVRAQRKSPVHKG